MAVRYAIANCSEEQLKDMFSIAVLAINAALEYFSNRKYSISISDIRRGTVIDIDGITLYLIAEKSVLNDDDVDNSKIFLKFVRTRSLEDLEKNIVASYLMEVITAASYCLSEKYMKNKCDSDISKLFNVTVDEFDGHAFVWEEPGLIQIVNDIVNNIEHSDSQQYITKKSPFRIRTYSRFLEFAGYDTGMVLYAPSGDYIDYEDFDSGQAWLNKFRDKTLRGTINCFNIPIFDFSKQLWGMSEEDFANFIENYYIFQSAVGSLTCGFLASK